MSRPRPERSVFNLGAVALPTLCCLLAGIIWVAATSGAKRQTHLPPGFSEQLRRAEAAAESSTKSYEQFASRLERFEEGLGDVSRTKSELVLLAGLIARAREQIAELFKTKVEAERKAKIDPHEKRKALIAQEHERLKNLQKENETAQKRVEELRKKVEDDVAPIPGVTYRGPYVLLECLKTGAVAYPAKRGLGGRPSEADLSWLLAEGERVGFIAMAVRPDAFHTTFLPFCEPLRERLEAGKIGFAYFPIEANEPIARYLPKGAQR